MIMTSVSFLLGLILCLLFGIPYIDFLKKRMIGQYIREEAPESHNQKAGTPTTGGVFIIIAALLASVTTLFNFFQLPLLEALFNLYFIHNI